MASQPSYTTTPVMPPAVLVTTANTNLEGSGSPQALTGLLAAGVCDSIACHPTGNAVASVARVLMSTFSSPAAGQAWVFDEVALPAVTFSNAALNQAVVFPKSVGARFPAGTYLFIVIGTTVANGWQVSYRGAEY